MMKDTISEFEKETGKFLFDVSELPETREEFDELTADLNKWFGVDYEYRVKFLEENGYELTRENVIDAHLPVRQELV